MIGDCPVGPRRTAARGIARVALILKLALAVSLAIAADSPPSPGSAKLVHDQEQVTAQFQRFEEVLLRMAELTSSSDPKRAALLRKAVADSKRRQVGSQLQQLVDVLRSEKLAVAVTDQTAVEQDLGKLLELLLTEQRGDQLKQERERLKEQLRKLKELINRQMQVQAQTERPDSETRALAEAQGKLAEETSRLRQAMTPASDQAGKQAATTPPAADESSKKSSPSAEEGKPKGDKPDKKTSGGRNPKSENNPDSAPSDGDGNKQPESGNANGPQPGDGKSQTPPASGGKSSPPGGDPSADGQVPSDESGDSQPEAKPSDDPPGRRRVAEAEKKMADAQKKLADAERTGAARDQEEAVRQLERARAELEEILRQLRQEEAERSLAQLEARFRKMLEMQREVYEGTQRLDRIPLVERTRNDKIEAERLGRRESLIVVEIDKALLVLREDGTAVALPEAVEQLRDDVEQIVKWLASDKVDARTLALEEDAIAALEELISAIKKAQQQLDQKKQAARPGQSGSQEPGLVDRLSELKVIRALQMRINQRTKRYESLLQDDVGQAREPDLVEQLQRLGEQQQRVYRSTRDIVVGKNQ